MSPRRTRPRRSGRPPEPEPLDSEQVMRGVGRVQAHPDGEWLVRDVTGAATGKTYRCPGCDQEIRPGVAHVVAWPADERGDLSDRRHWHSGCWQARDRRAPGVQRSRSAPRYG